MARAPGRVTFRSVDQAAILRHAQLLQQATSLKELMQVTELAVQAVSRYRSCWLAILEDDLTQVRILGASAGIEALVLEKAPVFPVGQDAMLKEIVEGRRVCVVVDARTDPRTDKAMVERLQNRTIINVPVVLGDRLIGALGIGTYAEEGPLPPTEAETDALVVFAVQLGAAFERVRHAEERQRVEQERNRVDRRLEVLQRVELMGVLASGVAHDLNNLLSVILANLGNLEQVPPGDDGDAVRDSLQAAERAREVVRQLLTLGRVQAPRREPVDLQAHLGSTVQLVRSSLPRGVVLTREAGPTVTVEGDPVQLDQAFANLVINARDAVGDRGAITVGVEEVQLDARFAERERWARAGRFARVRVKDTGPGIRPELLERIYDPLFSTKPQGTGLGLAVVSRVVQEHRGLLRCDSALGQGTTFEVYLPSAAA